ncbi:Thiol:disulfide interchange protein DsbE [Thalassocella blandensis]|nr:Thiol:disulfide interchange protein DsbE [Thalassocella blandensis]
MQEEEKSSSRLKLFIPLGVFLVLAGFLGWGLKLDPNELPSALIDKPMPAFSLPLLNVEETSAETEEQGGDGPELVTHNDLKGEPYLLNIWATWCYTCQVEHPYLMKLAERGVKIVSINYKDEDEAARKWLNKLGNPYALTIVDQEGRLGLDLGVYGAPETFVIDANGIVKYRHVGEVNEQVWKGTLAPLMIQ